MRGVVRRLARDEEEESAFVSMTDLTVSFLFIVIILLAFFASQLNDGKTVPVTEYEKLRVERDELLTRRDTLERERARLADELVQARGEIARLEEELRTANDLLDRERTRLTDELAQARREIARLEEELRTAKNAFDRERNLLSDKLAQARREIARLEEELRQERLDSLQTYLAGVSVERDRILQTLRERLLVDIPELRDIVSIETDALRFKGDGLFASGASRLTEDKRRIVEAIAVRLDELLPCYTFGKTSRWDPTCNPVGAVIEAVQIEGHTDSSGQDRANFSLSAERAIETLFAMSTREPALLGDLNNAGQPVVSVSGYGRLRPVADNSSDRGKATNRRIDLRIIMYTPQSADEVERIRANLKRGLAGTALQ